MRKALPFDSLYETASTLAASQSSEADYCVSAIRAISGEDAQSADEVFLDQNGRFQAFVADGANLDAFLAELVFSLDRLTSEVSADLDSFRGLTFREKMAGWWSRQRMWRLHSQRVREAPIVERLLDVLAKSDRLVGLISLQRQSLADHHKMAETYLIDIVEHRRRLVDSIDIARMKMKELAVKAMNTQGRIGVYGSRSEWERLEGERQAMKAEIERISSEEHGMRDESQRRERFIGMFQMCVDSMNGRIAVCNVLLRKIAVDVEERLIIYQAQVDTDRPGSMTKIKPEVFENLAGPIALFHKSMLVPQDLERRKGRADGEFTKRFPAYAENSEEVPHLPLIDTMPKPSFRLFKYLRS